ncbi:HNH endonuclease [Pseudomonas sp. MN1F]|uniref:HNH endonuclease n=1 Tax=Pseudomonas sp. MN1F TaxID=1366632 RepID=UPI0015B3FCA4
MQFNGQFYRTHRVIYYMHTGIDPAELVIDHRDGDCLNNNVENLRACTQQQNKWNSRRYAKSSDLPKGISKLPNGWYRVQVSINGEPHVSELANIRAAKNYLKTRRKESHGEFARNE